MGNPHSENSQFQMGQNDTDICSVDRLLNEGTRHKNGGIKSKKKKNGKKRCGGGK